MPAPPSIIRRLLRGRHPVSALLVSATGVAVCVVALTVFVVSVATNNLPWYPGFTIQDHYREMGRSYSQGFIVGFFLCFFLVLGAVSFVAWLETRRGRRGRARNRQPGRDVQAA